MIPKIGLRNLNTAISVLLCILVIRLFRMGSPFFACIAAVVVVQHTVDSAFCTGLYRMMGTLVGAVIGILFANFAPHNIYLIAVGIILVIYLTELLNQKNSTSMACIVFLAITINLNSASPLEYSISRVLETLVGILIGVGVNSVMRRYQKPEDTGSVD